MRLLLRALWAVLAAAWLLFGAFMLVIVLTHPAVGAELRRGELEMLARVVQAETTGEPAAGQRAVAWTVLNRLREPETYGKTITRVLLRPYQYARPAPLDDASPAFLRALLATVQVLLGAVPDDAAGATHFYRCDMRRPPRWAATFRRTVKIGHHCFHKAGK